MLDLSGVWDVRLDNGDLYKVQLPGTLDTNKIGNKDSAKNQWHPVEGLGEESKNNLLLKHSEVITTRFTRNFTYEGEAVYIKEFAYKKDPSKRVFLEIERSRKLSLICNGNSVVAYKAGTLSTPYVFEITNELESNNRIELSCDNTYKGWPHDSIVFSSAATDETQTNWNGMLGYIRLREENKIVISDIRVYPDVRSVSVQIDIDADIALLMSIHIDSEALKMAESREIVLSRGFQTITLENLQLKKDVLKWDEYEGKLYELEVTLGNFDKKLVTFGVRNFKKNNGFFNINDRKIFLRCETNCCVFPETGHMPMNIGEWLEILNTYKSYGINCVRFHSHCPPKAAFEAGDRMGMLIQPELSHWNPKNAFEDEESWNYYRLEAMEIIKQYANHPSFVMLTLGNELYASELGLKRMEAIVENLKNADKTRLYANGSNVFFGTKGADQNSDFFTGSNYYQQHMRGTSSGMIGYINEIYPNTKTNFDKEMEVIRKDYKNPVFGFEVGQYEVLPDFDEIEAFKGVTNPDNFKLIKKYAMERGFIKDWKKRVEATGELSRLAYREEIEAALRTESFSGISLLGLQDFPGQGTALVGMLDSHMKPKAFSFAYPERFKHFFHEVVPLVYMEKHTYTKEECFSAEIVVSNYSKKTISTTTKYELFLEDTCVCHGALIEKEMKCGELTNIGALEIPLSFVEKSSKYVLKISVEEFWNEYDIWVYVDKIQVCSDMNFDDSDGEQNYTNELAYCSNENQDCSNIYIASSLAEALELLKDGKTVLLSPKATLEHFPNSVQSQFTTDFWSVGTFENQGGCMGCLMEPTHPVFNEFPTEFHTNWQWWPMTKGRAMIIPEQIDPIITVIDSYARMRKMAFLFECKVGDGKLMVSSMGLLEIQQYPEARALKNSIIAYMGSTDFDPKQELEVDILKAILC